MTQRRMLAACLGAAVLIVAGCGPGEVVPDRGQLAVAAAATTDARTARMHTSFTMEIPGLMDTVTAMMDGVVDFVSGAGQMSMTQDMGAYGSMSMEVILLDGFMYIRTDKGTAEQTGVPPGSWMRQEAPDHAGWFQDPMTSGHPAEMLEMLREVGGTVETVGTEQVRGVRTTRYRGSATGEDMARVHGGLDPDVDPGIDLASMRTEFDVWVDDDHLMRRMRLSSSAPAPPDSGLEGELRSEMDMELYDFGVEVNISAPPEDEVVEYDPHAPLPDPGIGLDGEYSGSWESSDEFIIETAPGMLEGFPEEFPIHPAAWVMGSEQTPTGHEVSLRITASDQDDVDRIVAEHERSLEGHGWTITGRASGDGREVFEIAGHGWTGTVTLQHNPDQSEIMIGVTLARDEQ